MSLSGNSNQACITALLFFAVILANVVVLSFNDIVGSVITEGEKWSARSDLPAKEGETLSIVDRENLLLVV